MMPLFSKVSASAIAALVAIAPAAAQPPAGPDTQPDQTLEAPTGSRIITVVGAIKDPAAPEALAARDDERVPELPIVYEDDDQG